MLLEHKGKRLAIDPSARIAPNATICGEVSIGADPSINFGAVVSAESGAVSIGANCVVMDTAVLRGVRGNPLTLLIQEVQASALLLNTALRWFRRRSVTGTDSRDTVALAA